MHGVGVEFPLGADTAAMAAVDDFEKRQEAEYSEYVATEPINIDGVRAFNVGDPVPRSHVERDVVAKEQVAKRSTKAGAAAAAPQMISEA